MTINEQLKELLQEFKYIKGQNLSIAKRVKALEEREKKEYETPLISIAEVALLHRIAKYLGDAVKEKEDPLEGILDLPIIEKLKPEDSILGRKMPKDEDVVSDEVLEELDEVLERD